MANEILVGLKIGATISGSLHAAFSSAGSTLKNLGRASDELTVRQQRIGTALAAALAQGGSGIGKLRGQYDQLGRTLDQLRLKQDALTASMARGQNLTAQRKELRGQIMETVATGAVIGAPVVKALQVGMAFQDQLRDIRITAEIDPAEEHQLGQTIRRAALDKNQTVTAINEGVNTLVAGNISDVASLKQYIPIMAETATATKASMEDLGKSTVALRNNMDIGAQDYKAALNMLAAGGKAGQFELNDMAKWLPALTPQLQSLGMKGLDGLAQATSHLQVARMGAGSSDEAANNYKNFLTKITAPDTIKAFADAGIDLKSSLDMQVAKGRSPVDAALYSIQEHLGGRTGEAAAKYKAALEIKDDGARTEALAALDKSFKLGELFRDQQVAAFLRPALANLELMKQIEAEAKGAADKDVIGKDFALRMETAGSSVQAFQIGLTELALSVSDALLPTFNELLKDIVPVVRQFAGWAQENPALLKGLVGLAAGGLAVRVAWLSGAYALNLLRTGLNMTAMASQLLSSKWWLLRANLLTTRLAPLLGQLGAVGSGAAGLGRTLGGSLVGGLRLAGQAVLWLGRALLLNPVGLIITGIAVAGLLIYKYWQPIKAFFSGVFEGLLQALEPIGSAFAAAFAPMAPLFRAIGEWLRPVAAWFGELLTPVQASDVALGEIGSTGRRVGQALGAVLGVLFTPLRWLLRLIAGAPSVFEDLGKATGKMWGEIKRGFSGGLGGIARTLLNFSPLGLLYRGFSALMNYLGVEMPGTLSELGAKALDALGQAWTSMTSTVSEAAGQVWASIQAKFDSGLGGILQALLDFSPVGLLYQAFASVLSYLGVELPGKLSELGAGLITRLAEGILAKAAALRDAVLGIGRSIREALSFGDEQPKLGQAGASITAPAGIARANRTALEQLQGRPASNSPVLQPRPLMMAPEPPPITQRRPALDSLASANARNLRGGDMSVQFSPNINLAAGGEVQQVERALHAGFDEFEQMMRRYELRNARRNYGEMS